MHTFMKLINQNAPVIQAFSAVALLIVTIKLIHAPHRAFLRPVKIALSDTGGIWTITIRNFGPGLATNILVNTIAITKHEWDKLYPQSSKGWATLKMITAKGSYEIKPGEEASYDINYLLDFRFPFFIRWRTITGFRQKNAWMLIIDREDIIKPLSLIMSIKLFAIWVGISLKTSYSIVLKWCRSQIAKRRDKNKE